jgi:serine protease
MRGRVRLLFAVLLAAGSAPLGAQDASALADAGTARVIVKFKTGSSLVRAQALSPAVETAVRARALGARLGLPLSAGATVSDLAQVVFAAGVTSAELAQRLAQESDVEYAVPDERRQIVGAPTDPLYAAGVSGNGPEVGQWYLRAPSGDVQSSLNIEGAWAVTTGSPDIVVAVVDTGVRYEHPDLLSVAVGGHLLPGYDMASDPATANDGDGRDADPSDPGDWVTQAELSQRGGPFFRCTTSPETSSWHGTQVSGLIAALTNNGIGMAGTACPRQVRRLRLRHHRGPALGGRALRPRRARQPVPRAGDQREPRRRRCMFGRVSGGGR